LGVVVRTPHPHPGHRRRPSAKASFDGDAEHYDWVARHLMRGPYRRIAVDVVSAAPPGAGVLDVGTGPGRLLVEIARLRADLRLTGVDLSRDMVATARRNLADLGERATAVEGDVADLPFGDDSFDLVVSSLSLHHWADPAAGAGELARVLRPGGLITATTAGQPAAAGGPPRPTGFRVTGLPLPVVRRLIL
jgi:ubiquinone/menaquinone biosynthesis C-methylase UbiE